MKRLYLAAFLTLSVLAGIGHACAAPSEPRIALVVGNSAYRNAPPLRNPVNDARDMAKALRELGFQVIQLENGTKQQLERAIGQFSAKLTDSSVGLFYYSGHGIQENGHNYLIPVEAELATEGSVMLETVDVDVVLQLMNLAQTRVNLVILDACRSNPFERRFRGLGRGLAPVEQAPRGTLIAYSTAPGKVASDGDGANGLYTAELLKAIRQPGLTVEQIFKTVRIGVSTASNDNQTPWEASSLTGEFFFKPLAPVVAAPSPPPAPAPAANPDAADIAFWNSIKDASQAAPFETYLKRFPKGLFSDLAQFKIAALAKPTGTQAPSAPSASVSPTSPPVAQSAPAMGAQSPAQATAAAQPSSQTALLTPPSEQIVANAAKEFGFHCPPRGTVVEYDNGFKFTFTAEDRFRCGYWIETGTWHTKRAEKVAGFAEDARFLDAGLDKLWPLQVGRELKMTVSVNGAFLSERFAVLRRESTVVPAGTFETFVVEQVEITAGRGGQDAKRLFWFAPGPGLIVKSSFVLLAAGAGQGEATLSAGDYQATSVDVPSGVAQ
jgi:uncharacterized caspase-like protein